MWYGGLINIYVPILYSRESLLDGYYGHATPVFMSDLQLTDSTEPYVSPATPHATPHKFIKTHR